MKVFLFFLGGGDSKIRLSKHLRDFRNQKGENSLAGHLNSNNHSSPEDTGIILIKAERNPKFISPIESLGILKSFNKNWDLFFFLMILM